MRKTILSLISIVGLTLGLNNCKIDRPLKRELLKIFFSYSAF